MNYKSKLKKYAIGFVIYNPEKNFDERIEMILKNGYEIYLFDNSPENNHIRLNKKAYLNYFTSGKNVGLGIGLSTICSNSFYDGFEYMIFFDQDSFFSINTLEFIDKFIENKENNIINFSVILFNSKKYCAEERFVIDKKDLIISSGSFFNLNVCQKINWHNTNFFVDNVDYEFCLRSKKCKFLVGECSYAPEFDHVTGQADIEYKYFGKKKYLRVYSWSRIIDAM